MNNTEEIRGQLLTLIRQLKNKGMEYADMARSLDISSQVMYNIRKGRSANVTQKHVNILKRVLEEYKNPVQTPTPPPPTFATHDDIDKLKAELTAELRELQNELSALKDDFVKHYINKNMLLGKKNQTLVKDDNGPNS